MANAFMDAVQQGLQVSGILDNMKRLDVQDQLVSVQLETAKVQHQQLVENAPLMRQMLEANVLSSQTQAETQGMLKSIIDQTKDFEVATKKAEADAARFRADSLKWAQTRTEKLALAEDATKAELLANPNIPDSTKLVIKMSDANVSASIFNAVAQYDQTLQTLTARAEEAHRQTLAAKAEAERIRKDVTLSTLIGAVETAGKGNIGPMEYLLSSNALELPGAQYNRLAALYTKIKSDPQAYAQRVSDNGVGALISAFGLFGTTTEETTKSTDITDTGIKTTNKKVTQKGLPAGLDEKARNLFNSPSGQRIRAELKIPPGTGMTPEDAYVPKDGYDFAKWSGMPENKGKFYKKTDGSVGRNL